jgi:16S rRNA (cytosine967-C5)-methyltransferase
LAIVLARVNVSPARWTAFDILRKVEDGAFSSVLLAEQENQLKETDRALCHELVLGVLRWQLTLDECITHFSNRKLESLDRAVLIALRLGLYQLRFLTRIPVSAAVDESVKLVQAARLSSARAFVNAILRRATREPDYNPAASLSDPGAKLSIETSHPVWLIERWIESFGFEETKAFAHANNEFSGNSFRIVRRRAREADVLEKLKSAGVEYQASTIVTGGWKVSRGSKILRDLAAGGEVYFQDEASQLVAQLVDPQENDYVLDLCSAPGGKTTLLADRFESSLMVATDFSEKRLRTVRQSVEKQDLSRVSLLLLDAGRSLPFASNSFDRVLVDAPCSGTGTVRHNPEIRWRVTDEDITRLASQQVEFLVNASKVLKVNGRLIYSTCSVEKEENEAVVAKFLELESDFRQTELKHESVPSTSTGALRTWPHRDGTDGFFVAAFEKESRGVRT